MDRRSFHRLFKCPGPAVLPVIHVQDTTQIERNIRVCIAEGAQGVFLINHDFDVDTFVPMLQAARDRFDRVWLGVNFLAVTGKAAFPQLSKLADNGYVIDAYWADDARIDERCEADAQVEAREIDTIRQAGSWRGLYFGGTAFKKQRPVAASDYGQSAAIAADWMDVVTTSGVATGKAVDGDKVTMFRTAIADRPLALASGVTPANAAGYATAVDAFLVATGVSAPDDFYNLDARALARLIEVCREAGGRTAS